MNDDQPRFIVGEVSKNWTLGSEPVRPTISQLFEDIVRDAVSRGYTLHSWRLATVEDSSFGMINETVVAVFERQAFP